MPKFNSIRTRRNYASDFLMTQFLFPRMQLVEQLCFSFLSITNLPALSVNSSSSCQVGTLKTPCDGVLSESHSAIEYEVTQERLRQAHLSFNAALTVTTLSAAMSLAGIGLLLFGKVPEGVVTTTAGLTSNCVSACCLRLTKDANDRLDRMALEQLEWGQLIARSTTSNED